MLHYCHHLINTLDGHLLQIGIVDPDAHTIANDQLREGFFVGPTEFPWPRKRQRALGFLNQLAAAAEHLLFKICPRRLRGIDELGEALGAGGARERGQQQKGETTDHPTEMTKCKYRYAGNHQPIINRAILWPPSCLSDITLIGHRIYRHRAYLASRLSA